MSCWRVGNVENLTEEKCIIQPYRPSQPDMACTNCSKAYPDSHPCIHGRPSSICHTGFQSKVHVRECMYIAAALQLCNYFVDLACPKVVGLGKQSSAGHMILNAPEEYDLNTVALSAFNSALRS